jgi:hypothetical protein
MNEDVLKQRQILETQRQEMMSEIEEIKAQSILKQEQKLE